MFMCPGPGPGPGSACMLAFSNAMPVHLNASRTPFGLALGLTRRLLALSTTICKLIGCMHGDDDDDDDDDDAWIECM